jgi:hypothetical protein
MTSTSYSAFEDRPYDSLRGVFDENVKRERAEPAQHLSRLLLHDANAALASMGAEVTSLLSGGAIGGPAHLLHDGVARLAGIVRMLGVLERETGPRLVHLNALVVGAVTLFRNLTPSGIPVATQLEDPLPAVWGDALDLERGLLALLLETSDRGTENSFVMLSTRHVRADSTLSRKPVGDFRVVLEIEMRAKAPPDSEALARAVHRSGGVVQRDSFDGGGHRIQAWLPAYAPESPRAEQPGEGDRPTTPSGDVTALSFPPFHLDLVNESLRRGTEVIPLTPKPFGLLRYLAEHPLRLVTQRELVGAVWGRIATCESLIRTHVRALRRVLGAGVIETVNCRGYRFTLPVVQHRT